MTTIRPLAVTGCDTFKIEREILKIAAAKGLISICCSLFFIGLKNIPRDFSSLYQSGKFKIDALIFFCIIFLTEML